MRKRLLQILSVIAIVMLNIATVVAQGTVTGKVVDATSEEGLISATITIKGTTIGSVTANDGSFTINNVPSGEQTVVITYLGYTDLEQTVNVSNGQTTDLGTIQLSSASIGISEVQVISSIAVDRKTPVAVSTIRGAEITDLAGNQEFPEILNRTPSVYATKTGGGYGDARINVRGFDQNNTAVMINGIPVNDMENGQVYWSNWAGLTDVASTVQVQRGLGASKLAVPSVGGSINIITNPAERTAGGRVQLGYGNDNYFKATASYSTGLMVNGFAATFLVSTARGDGYVDGTAFEAYNYFASLSYTPNANHTLVLTALGAPQIHNQRLGASPFDNVTLNTFRERGIKFNNYFGSLDGKEYSWRQNFYHKPKVFVNHYWTINEKTDVKTSAYVSFGRGGGTGPRGRLRNPTTFDSFSGFGQGLHDQNGQVRFDDIVAYNQGDSITGGGFGNVDIDPGTTNSSGDGFIRRASMNYHNWYGILSTITHEVSDELTLTAGIDGRYYKGEHFRRVENLLGNTSYVSRADRNNPTNSITTADEVRFGNFHNTSYRDGNNVLNYWNDGLVTWLGAFGQLEYSTEKLSLFGTLTLNQQGFKRVDYFNYEEGDTPANDVNGDGEYRASNWENFIGYAIKGGANYNIDEKNNIFVNAGYLTRPPLFDVVFINFRNQVNDNANNQTTTSFEAGYGYREGGLSFNANVFSTMWVRQFDANFNYRYANGDEVNVLAIYQNVAQLHQGVEAELYYTPIPKLSLTGMASVGNYRYASDFDGMYTDTDNNVPVVDEENLPSKISTNNLKVGDAAQTSLAASVDFRPCKGLKLYGRYQYFDNLYAQFRVENGVPDEIAKLPAYSLVHAGGSYNFMFGDTKATFGLNINNLLNTTYVSEMFTNIQDDPSTPENDFYNNKGFFGFGRTWNAFLRVNF